MQIIDHAADPRALRETFGRFATGVTVVSVATPDGPLGITANSFTSVSLDPPLILWCPACASLRHDRLVGAGRFALNVLAADQADIAEAFSRSGEAFAPEHWQVDEHGLALLEGAAARFVCTTQNRLPAGDHTIVLGAVERAENGNRPGLIFAQGLYGGFTAKI